MDVIIKFTYKTLRKSETVFTSEKLPAKAAILFAEDLQQTGRLKNIVFIDDREREWSLKKLKQQLAALETEAHHITVYFDGGYQIHTKIAGLACVIYYEKNGKKFRFRRNARVEGIISNNEAEYAALHLAIQELELLDVRHLPVTIKGDSKVVINQLSGEWPCYELELVAWADKIDAKLDVLGIRAIYNEIMRNENKEADKLATQALREIDILSTKEL